jgi:hypothetical protein
VAFGAAREIVRVRGELRAAEWKTVGDRRRRTSVARVRAALLVRETDGTRQMMRSGRVGAAATGEAPVVGRQAAMARDQMATTRGEARDTRGRRGRGFFTQ